MWVAILAIKIRALGFLIERFMMVLDAGPWHGGDTAGPWHGGDTACLMPPWPCANTTPSFLSPAPQTPPNQNQSTRLRSKTRAHATAQFLLPILGASGVRLEGEAGRRQLDA